MPRWVAISLGCVAALGMQIVFELLGGAAGLPSSAFVHYGAMVLALILGGYVAGNLTGRLHAFHGALAAVLYVLVTVTFSAVSEAREAHELQQVVLPSIDLVQLVVTDVLAMTAATWGGWLAGRS